jgi:hypothetical protein
MAGWILLTQTTMRNPARNMTANSKNFVEIIFADGN